MAVSGFSLHPLYCCRPLLSIIVATMLHPVTTDQITIITIPIEPGSQATGSRGGLPMVGRESGFRVIGSTALNGQKLA